MLKAQGLSRKSSTSLPLIEDDAPAVKRPGIRPVPSAPEPSAEECHVPPRSAFRSWPEIRKQIRAAKRWAFLLDFDGTLVNLRRRPSDVRMSTQAKRTIQSLVRHANVYVAMVSGRSLRDLRRLVDVKGLHYFGLQGGEREGNSAVLGRDAFNALESAKQATRTDLSPFAGIWIEDKGLSFSVHNRAANAATTKAAGIVLAKLVAQRADVLHVLNGSRVWEVLPREIPGKSAAVEEVLRKLPAGASVVYIGDDGTDEMAFAVLPNQITVRVGRDARTLARYSVRTPAEVLRLLARLEKELP